MFFRWDYSSHIKIRTIFHNILHSAPLEARFLKKSPVLNLHISPLCDLFMVRQTATLSQHNVAVIFCSLCRTSLWCEMGLIGKPVEIGYRSQSVYEQFLQHNTYRNPHILRTLLKPLLC